MLASVQPPKGIAFDRIVIQAKNTSGTDIPANRLVKVTSFFNDTDVPSVQVAGTAEQTTHAPIGATESVIRAGRYGEVVMVGAVEVERGGESTANLGNLMTQITPDANGQFDKPTSTQLACGLVIKAGGALQGDKATILIDAFGRGFTNAF
jgi:hypothetical protein|tara:strand:- start:658 stop:1110 length:453 start_codon:yes stop_codon:yes gene_type:complete